MNVDEEQSLAYKWANNNKDAYHFWFGIISGFPLCCVIYFCDSWLSGINTIEELCEINTIEFDKRVMCPLCIINELNKH